MTQWIDDLIAKQSAEHKRKLLKKYFGALGDAGYMFTGYGGDGKKLFDKSRTIPNCRILIRDVRQLLVYVDNKDGAPMPEKGWIHFNLECHQATPGALVTDYSVNLEPAIAAVNKECAKWI